MNKTIGYILAGIGIIAIALSYPGIRTLVGLKSIFGLSDFYLMIGGLILAIIGGFLAYKGGQDSEVVKEIPIYEGHGKQRKIVGYERVKD